MKSKELRAQRFKLVEDANAVLNAGEGSAEAGTKFDEMMAAADVIKAEIDRHERAEIETFALAETLRSRGEREGVSADEAADRQTRENDAFTAYMRGGFQAMTEPQRALAMPRFQAAQGTGTGSSGGYTVPDGFYGKLEDAEKAYGGMLEVSFVLNTSDGQPIALPTDNDTSNSGSILAENTQVSAQDVTFGSMTLGAYTYTSKIVLVANQLLQDSAFDLNSFLAMKLGTRIARAINTHFTTGSGSSQPFGAVTDATQGKPGASGETTSLIFDDLIDLEHSVDPAYRRNARFMMNDTTLKVIKKLKDSQSRYLWQPGLPIQGEPDRINNYPYTINQDMADPAASAKTILFGDFSKYFVRKVAGVQMLRLTERYADYNQTGFVAFQRWDGKLIDAGTHPLKYFIHASS